jgi:hypothetical protein
MGTSCSQKIPETRAPSGVVDVVGSDGSQGAVAGGSAASAASGSSFLQLFDSLQTIMRFAMLDVRFPLWYLSFVEGFSIAMLNFRMPFVGNLISASIIEDTDEASPDPITSPNLVLYSEETMGTVSGHFILYFTSFVSVLSVVTLIFIASYLVTAGAFKLRVAIAFRGRRKSSIPADVANPQLFARFLIFFRGIYFMVYYASVYPMCVAVALQFTIGATVRPAWETALAVVMVSAYGVVLVWWVIPFVRHGRNTKFPKFSRSVNTMLYDYHAEFWWLHLLHMFVFVVDAVVVVAGTKGWLSAESQLSILLLFSCLRVVITMVYHPTEETKKHVLDLMCAVMDLAQLLVAYRLVGYQRTSSLNDSVMFVVSVVQMVVVLVNLVASLLETVVKVCLFVVSIAALLLKKFNKRSASSSNVQPKSKHLAPILCRPELLVPSFSQSPVVKRQEIPNVGKVDYTNFQNALAQSLRHQLALMRQQREYGGSSPPVIALPAVSPVRSPNPLVRLASSWYTRSGSTTASAASSSVSLLSSSSNSPSAFTSTSTSPSSSSSVYND